MWPFLERWATGDHAYHNVNDRPRNAPTRTAFGLAGVTFYGVLWLEGANDIIAVHLQIPLYLTTEIARWAIFIGPAIAFWVTRRICLGLQRRDASMLLHGVETGIIVQQPDGAFVELERPLDEGEIAVIAAKPPAPITVGREVDDNGIPEPSRRGVLGKVQEQAHELFAESISLVPPADGHGNGHGNGHAIDGGNGHAAVEGEDAGEPAAVGGGPTAPSEAEDGRTGEGGE